MARKRRRRGTGSVIQVKELSGTGKLDNPNSAVGASMPILFGGATTALVTLGIRQMMTPTTQWQASVVEFAPWVGMGAGALVGLVLWNTASRASGIAALTASAVLGLAFVTTEAAARMRLQTAGVGAVVPEYSLGRALPARGTGAIALEPTADRGYGAGPLGGTFGEDVTLHGVRGLGNVNQDAFGTPAFGR